MSAGVEVSLMWAAVLLYAFSSAAYAAGAVFGSKWLLSSGVAISSAGVLVQTVAFVLRWFRVGHLPFLGFYEVVAAYAYATAFTVVLLGILRPRLRSLGMVLMPVALLALGVAMFADKTGEATSGTLSSWWLAVHVLFAKLSYSSFIVAFALSVIYVVRGRIKSAAMMATLERLPDQESLDDLSYRFASVGLVFLSVMIAAGAIWANEAWGRYWAWDPIETWSLVTWLTYSLYLHVRLTLGWRGRKSAWLLIGALPVVAFSFVVVPVVYNSIHAAYMRGI